VVGQVTAPDARPQSAADRTGRDDTTRRAALWATAVALPLAVLVGVVAFAQLRPEESAVRSDALPTATPRPQSTAPVTMAATPLAQRPATVCRALMSQLPTTLGDLLQRPVTAGPEQNAAYGDPAITVACGVPAPSFPPEDEVWVVNGVCWHQAGQAGHAEQAEQDGRTEPVVLTTVDREVPVRVTVPRDYDPPLQWVAPLAEKVVASVPSTPDTPAGCTG